MCQIIKTCSHSEGGKAEIKGLGVDPPQGSLGQTFIIGLGFEVFNQTSTGEVAIDIRGPGAAGTHTSSLNEGLKPGEYSAEF